MFCFFTSQSHFLRFFIRPDLTGQGPLLINNDEVLIYSLEQSHIYFIFSAMLGNLIPDPEVRPNPLHLKSSCSGSFYPDTLISMESGHSVSLFTWALSSRNDVEILSLIQKNNQL